MKIKEYSSGILGANLLVPLAALCILLSVQAAQAQVINFDVPGATNETSLFGGGTYNMGVDYIGQGALSDPGNNYWNPVEFNTGTTNGTTSGDLLSDGITSSSITLTLAGLEGVYAGNDYDADVTNGTPPALFTPFGYATSTSSIILSNVPAGSYGLYVYGINGSDTGNGGSTAFTVGATTLSTMNNANRDTNVNATVFAENYSYVVFTNISPSNGTITLTAHGSGLGGNGSEVDFNGIQLLTAPTAPTDLSATPGSATVGLSWTASIGSPGPITYNIARSTINGGPYTTIATDQSGTTYADNTTANSNTYYYVVYAVNIGVAISPPSAESPAATPFGLIAPGNVTATPGNAQVALNWTAPTGAISYIIYSSTAGPSGTYSQIGTSTTATYTDTTAVNGITIYYEVVAVYSGGNSPSSTPVGTTPPGAPAPPTSLTATAGLSQVELNWIASATVSPGPISYNIGRSITNGGPYAIIATALAGRSYTDTPVGENAYYYVVYAFNDGVGPGIASTQASATPTGPPLVINFDVPGSIDIADNYSGLGAYPDAIANTNWNPVVNGGTTGPAIASDGLSITPITLTASGFNTYGGNNYGGAATGLELLFTPFAYSETQITLTLSNVPAGNYDLYIYGINGSDTGEGNSTAFTVDGITQDTLQTILPDSSTNFVEDRSYVLFAGVMPTNGIITINATGAGVGGNPHETDFNGLQLTPYLIMPPTITSQPQSEELFAGSTASFTTAATGGGLSYQWYTTGNSGATTLSGATNATLTIANVSSANVTNYYCLVTNANTGAYQSTNSVIATLTIVPPSGTFQIGVTNLNPLHYYAFDDTGSPSPGPEVAFDYAGGDNGVYGLNCENGSTPVAGPRPSPDGFPGFSSTNYAVYMLEGYEPCNVPVNSPWFLNTNTVTITAWINPGYQPESTGTIIVMNSGGNSDIEGLDFINNTTTGNSDLGYTWNNDPATTSWDSGLMPPANQWSFVALVVTPTSATSSMMNANGITNATFVHDHAKAAFAGRTIIGDNPAFLTGLQNGFYTFDGAIDEMGVFNHALTQNQVANLYADATQVAPYNQPATIASPELVGSKLTLTGSNGAAFGSYHVLTSTNLTLPLQNWTVVTNGTFSATGSFSVVLSDGTSAASRFFSIVSP
jgi:hypothetical protein